MNFTSFNIVQAAYDKFGILDAGEPRALTSAEEYRFRIKAMFEELVEFIDAASGDFIECESVIRGFNEWIDEMNFMSPDMSLPEQFDALIDLVVFAMGTAARQNLPFDEGFARVMNANMKKELGPNQSKERGSFALDLVKPEGWESPDLNDLCYPQPDLSGRLLVLEGADGTGKSTFAEYLRVYYDAEVIHCSWSKEINESMDDYLLGRLNQVHELLQDGKFVVLDRHWISDWIYSTVFRNGPEWKGLHLCCFYGLRNLGATYVNFSMPKDEYAGHISALMLESDRLELYTDVKKLEAVNGLYSSFTNGDLHFIKNGMVIPEENVCHYDLMKTSPSQFMESTLLPKLLPPELPEGEE